MIVRELLELIEKKRRLYPEIDNFHVVTLYQYLDKEDYYDSLEAIENKVTIDHQKGKVVISTF